MKILYAVQGTGNGHLSRAKAFVPAFEKFVRVDLLVSGMHSEIDPGHRIRYRFNGLGFKFGKQGGIDLFSTWYHGDILRFFREADSLDMSEYDMVVNDFEPVSARAAKRAGVPCIGLSNQCVLLDSKIPKPENVQPGHVTKAVFKHYAPVDVAYGFHYTDLNRFITTPPVREEVRKLKPEEGSHYLVYLPFYSDEKIVKALNAFPRHRWVVFSKHGGKRRFCGNVELIPVNDGTFLDCLATCKGVFCSAGFGITTEALFLGKKLLVMPMKKQFEQACNAYSLAAFGVNSVKSLKPEFRGEIAQWLQSRHTVQVHYPDRTECIAERILTDFAEQNAFFRAASDVDNKSVKTV